MVDTLFNFYKNELSLKSILFSDSIVDRLIYNMMHTAQLWLPVLGMSWTFILQNKKELDTIYFIPVFILIISIVLTIIAKIYHHVGTKKVHEIYQEEIKKLSIKDSDQLPWYSTEIKKIMRKDVEEKIMKIMKNNSKVISSEDIKCYATKARKRAGEMKYKLPTKTLAFTALFLPILNNYSKSLFDLAAEPDTLTNYFMVLSGILLIIYLLGIIVDIFAKEIIETFYNKDYKMMIELEEILNELYMEIEIETDKKKPVAEKTS